ncbi:MAG: ribonuclease HI family protein [Candidatus Bathyarchaeota archaeon]|nr:ribonuclease HI family protein [Candidatus Bathyarchaeota archaeon]
MQAKIYSDGGARGNPGPAAAAYLIFSETGVVLKSDSRFLGKRTNNQAEYEGVLAGLEAAVTLGVSDVVFHLDSELVCRHLTGEYRVKNPELRKLWVKAQDLVRHFNRVQFVVVPRSNSFIQKADRLVNERLDEASGRRG